MSRIGLVLGGGGVTGAAFHFGALFSLRLATEWDPGTADVIVGTSSGAMVGALARYGALSTDKLVGDVTGRDELAELLKGQVFRRTRPSGVGRWMRHGLLPGLRRPGIRMALGSPAPYTTEGIAEWVRGMCSLDGQSWPTLPTIIAAYEIESHARIAFGTEGSPDVCIADAVAASSAVPLLFEPVTLHGRRYVDGGVASGTNADLILGSAEPLDLVIVSAPMASVDVRPDARFYEGVVDRLGGSALTAELDKVRDAWPDADIVVLRPDSSVLAVARPNPLDPASALPVFLRTLRSMRSVLGSPENWPILERHLNGNKRRLPWGRRLKTSSA